MIYAQRPDASACAAYELWNGTMHRYIRRGAKGIALLHSDPAGKMLGFECSSFMLQAVAKAVADAKKFREEAGL